MAEQRSTVWHFKAFGDEDLIFHPATWGGVERLVCYSLRSKKVDGSRGRFVYIHGTVHFNRRVREKVLHKLAGYNFEFRLSPEQVYIAEPRLSEYQEVQGPFSVGMWPFCGRYGVQGDQEDTKLACDVMHAIHKRAPQYFNMRSPDKENISPNLTR